MRNSILSLTAGVALSTLIAVDQADADNRRDRFRVGRTAPSEEASTTDGRGGRRPPSARLTEAPTGFDNRPTASSRRARFDTINEDNVVAAAFVQRQPLHLRGGRDDRRRPRPDLQRAELPRMPSERRDRRRKPDRRAPHRRTRWTATFFESLGGSLIHSRATHPTSSSASRYEDDVRTFRISTNTLGAGLRRGDRERDAAGDPRSPARGHARHGRHGPGARSARRRRASAASAGRTSTRASSRSRPTPTSNEMGITSPLFPEENTSSGRDVGTARVRSGAGPRGRRRRRRRVRRLHARDQGAAARGDHRRRAGRRTLFAQHRLRRLPLRRRSRPRAGHADQRRRVHRPGGARQQDHPSVQRLPAARHRHRRRHPGAADAGVRGDGRTRSAPRRCGRCARATA